jgi:hypothetical protein
MINEDDVTKMPGQKSFSCGGQTIEGRLLRPIKSRTNHNQQPAIPQHPKDQPTQDG